MPQQNQPDMSCVPYRRKSLYFALTIPFFALLVLVFVYLGRFSFFLSLIFMLLYLAMSYFQAYCCAYQNCPYVGGFCPAVIGIIPASFISKLLYEGKGIKMSKKRFDLYAILGTSCWLALVAFPLYWLAKLGLAIAVGYLATHVIYALIFGLTICPVCAIRHICPGGKFHQLFISQGSGDL